MYPITKQALIIGLNFKAKFYNQMPLLLRYKHYDSILFQLKTTKGQPDGCPFVISLIFEKKTGHIARPPEAVLGWWVGYGLLGLPL